MATYNGPLTKAPLREALIDIQFEPAISSQVINAFNELAKARFERSSPIWQTLFGMSITSDGPSHNQPEQTAIGVRLETDSPPLVLQCRANGFTLSRLTPYGCWGDLRSAAKLEWDQFLKVAPPITINRIAVRYINELKLPLPFGDFAEYLESPPDVPERLPQAVSSFLQRVVIPDQEYNCVSIITQALEDSSQIANSTVTVLLDIDVYRTLRCESLNSDTIWNALDQLRTQKNRMFFGYITDKMVETFK